MLIIDDMLTINRLNNQLDDKSQLLDVCWIFKQLQLTLTSQDI